LGNRNEKVAELADYFNVMFIKDGGIQKKE